MILAVDIGNTNIVLGGFSNSKLDFVARMATDSKKTDSEYCVKIKEALQLHGYTAKNIEGSIISSVVPSVTGSLQSAIRFITGKDALVVGPGVKTGINLLVDNPSSVGADIICDCVGGYELYKKPVLIIDMGTATKMIVVDENGAFRGMSIIPGVVSSLRALAGNTALLPEISLEKPKRAIGRDTAECMRSGVIFGNSALVDGMTDRMTEELGKEMQLVATGGLAKTVISCCRHKIDLDNDLLLKGLYSIYQKNK